MYEAEVEKFNNYMQLSEIKDYWAEDEAERYLFLLYKHKEALIVNINENEIWEWFGGAQLLVQGQKRFLTQCK
jgi:hypothetical protein